MTDKPRYRVTQDGLVSMTSGMGTGRDKGGSAVYVDTVMTPQQAMDAYHASALVRRVVDLPAEDAVREWRNWQAESAQISDVEAEEKRLGVQIKTFEARRMARLDGEAAILIGADLRQPEKPLDPRRASGGGLKYLVTLGKEDFNPDEIDQNVMSPTFGQPVMYRMADGVAVHPTRLAVFKGIAPRAGLQRYSSDHRGRSVLAGMVDDVKRVDEVAGNILSLVYEAKVDVFGIPDLMANMATRGEVWTSEILRRLTLAATGKGISGSLVMDANETYEQKSASFGGLPEILDRMMQLASASSGIPMTLLFGMSPAGMNATGDADTRGYYDRVKVQQTLHMQPAMSVLDECLIWSALSSRPDDLHYNWAPLWMPTAKERAETGKIIADTHKTALDMGLPINALAQSLVNGLTEAGAAPGLEGYMADEMAAIEAEADAEENAPGAPPLRVVGDAAPQTLYVSRRVLNGDEIIRWAKAQGFKTTLPASDLHVTIAFSRAPVDWMECGASWQPKLEVPSGGPRQIDQFGDARVLLFTDDELKWRHERIKEAGATWDHAEYQPHITVSYDPDAPDLADVQPYQGPIILGPEIFAKLDEDWAEKVKEQ